MTIFRELHKMQYFSVIHHTYDIDLSLFHNNRRKYSDHPEAQYSVIFMGFMSFSHSCGASIEFCLSVSPIYTQASYNHRTARRINKITDIGELYKKK